MWMLLSTTCVGLEVAQAPMLLVEVILMLGPKIFQLCRTLTGISMTENVRVEVETLKIMVICIR